MKPARRGRPVALVLALFALPAAAAPAPAEDCPAIDVPAPIAPARSALRAFVDPATGKLRQPTADELRRLAEERLKARQAAQPRVFEVITYPDGMQAVDLGDAFLFDVRLETLPDGSTRIECVPPARAPKR